MPVYEYQCGKCGVFEQSQRISAPALTKCPTCRRKVRRLISSTSFQLKGSGWYVTDYARSGQNGAKDGSKDGANDGAKDGESKSEAKEAKTDAASDAKTESKSTKAEKKKAGPTTPATTAS